MKLTRENRSTRGKTCPSATLSTANPTWTDPGSNPGLRIHHLWCPLPGVYTQFAYGPHHQPEQSNPPTQPSYNLPLLISSLEAFALKLGLRSYYVYHLPPFPWFALSIFGEECDHEAAQYAVLPTRRHSVSNTLLSNTLLSNTLLSNTLHLFSPLGITVSKSQTIRKQKVFMKTKTLKTRSATSGPVCNYNRRKINFHAVQNTIDNRFHKVHTNQTSALFWDICRVVIIYRRFGTCRSLLPGSGSPRSLLGLLGNYILIINI
jgi:hypothetical protein